jgi:tetratricopeptide (TPR) repeat protein
LRTLISITLALILLGPRPSAAQSQKAEFTNDTAIVLPFENATGAPGLEWVSEAFPETLSARLSAPGVFLLTRDDRLRAYDRAGIPAELHATRATMYRLMEQLDVDYVVLGRYEFDGRKFTASAQWLDMQHKKLLPECHESGSLTDLINIQTALSWDLLQTLRPELAPSKALFMGSAAPVRLDAFENYIRGILAGTGGEKVSRFREATRLNPGYSEAWLQLGKAYFEQRNFDQAVDALHHVSETDAAAREANFYLGLSAYRVGDFSAAQSAFAFVAARLPLTEVDNNLGVVTGRLGDQRRAADKFRKAVEQDPNDPDYHFNLGISLYRIGNAEAAVQQLQQCLDLRPSDAEAKSILAVLSRSASPGSAPSTKLADIPPQRLKQNFDENTFRQLLVGIQSAAEERLAHADPATRAHFYLSRGQELLTQGFAGEAEKEFRQSIQADPQSAEAHAALARALEANNDLTGARAEAEAALSIRVFIDPLLILARLDLRDNKTDAAAESLDRALKIDPANSSALTLKRAVAAKLAEKAQPLPN